MVSKYSIWQKFKEKNETLSRAIQAVFEGSDEVCFSRQDLFEAGECKDLNKFTLMTIIWGYPTGLRGNNFKYIASQFDKLVAHLEKIMSYDSIIWKKEVKFLDKFKGVGISTYSKFLYFLDLNLNNNPCLIIDRKLIKVFQILKI